MKDSDLGAGTQYQGAFKNTGRRAGPLQYPVPSLQPPASSSVRVYWDLRGSRAGGWILAASYPLPLGTRVHNPRALGPRPSFPPWLCFPGPLTLPAPSSPLARPSPSSSPRVCHCSSSSPQPRPPSLVSVSPHLHLHLPSISPPPSPHKPVNPS